MKHRIATLLAAAVLATTGVIGIGHAAAKPGESVPTTATGQTSEGAPSGDHGAGFGRRGHQRRAAADPVRVAARQLRLLERLYLVNGRGAEIPALYQDVLAHTQNPALRTFAYGRLAHAELRPAHPEQAIETLRKSVDESLKRVH